MKGLLRILFILFVPACFAATNDATLALQKGLFEEEANHDFNAAIAAYQSVVKQFDQDRKLAATAVFRLGECYRKQGHTNEANVQYERIVQEFSDQTALVTLSRSYLAGSGQPAPQESAGSAPASTGETEEVRRIRAMIKDSPDLVNAPDGQGQTPLHRAAQAGQVTVATFLLDNGADVNAKDKLGRTPLHLATSSGYGPMIDLLLSRGADVNAASRDSSTPTALDIAAVHGLRSLVELLLAHGANVNSAVPNRVSALHLAAVNGFKSVAEVLLHHGADVNATTSGVQNSSGQTYTGAPLHIAARRGDQTMAELLLANKADPNVKTEDGTTPLHVAAAWGQEAVAKLLLEHGAEVNSRNASGATPLASAVMSEAATVVKVLLAAKADPQIPFKVGSTERTPLYFAVLKNNADLVSELLKHGANPNVEDESDHATPLLQAAKLHEKDIAALLLGAKADPNTHDQNGATPLHFAVAEPETAGALLNAGAAVNAKDDHEDTPLHWAAGAGLKPGAELLVTHGADLNARDVDGDTPLHYAVLAGRSELADFLLAKGANPNLANVAGSTPLNWVKNPPPAFWIQLGNNASFMRESRPPPVGPFRTVPSPVTPGTMVPGRFALPGAPANSSSSSETRQELATALKSHGAVEDLPHLDRITVSRSDANYSSPVFYKGTNNWNQFTALELVGVEYQFLDRDPNGGDTQTSPNWAAPAGLAFPDLAHLRIRRPQADLKTWQEHQADLSPVLQSGDCSKDVPLAWGEVVEIPEADHPLNEPWHGFSGEELINLLKCLSRQVQIVIKGHATKVVLGPKGDQPGRKAPLWLTPALRQSNLLLASSDLSRVKVTRVDKATGQKRQWLLDCSDNKAPAFWLEDGDVIEVPEKP